MLAVFSGAFLREEHLQYVGQKMNRRAFLKCLLQREREVFSVKNAAKINRPTANGHVKCAAFKRFQKTKGDHGKQIILLM